MSTLSDSMSPIRRARWEAELNPNAPFIPVFCWLCGNERVVRAPDLSATHCLDECGMCQIDRGSISPMTWWNGTKILPND
jgi:ribosomal protein S27E